MNLILSSSDRVQRQKENVFLLTVQMAGAMRKDPAGSSVASASKLVLSTSCSAPAAAAARSPLPLMCASPRAIYLAPALTASDAAHHRSSFLWSDKQVPPSSAMKGLQAGSGLM